MDAQDNPGASGDMPLFAMTRRSGEQLWALFENAESVAATIERYAQGWPAYQDIASFSSFGPTSDRRIKPDIVGPGELVSAASADMDPAAAGTPTCNMGRKAGTSMATPMVAGHTAIIRQYFVDGFYPSGAVGNAGYLPSGPLLKAVMLGGACDMQGNTEQYLPLEDSPSMRQGFGLLCLCNSLRLGSNCTTNMQVRGAGGLAGRMLEAASCWHSTGGARCALRCNGRQACEMSAGVCWWDVRTNAAGMASGPTPQSTCTGHPRVSGSKGIFCLYPARNASTPA